jgi:hypothetical protein
MTLDGKCPSGPLSEKWDRRRQELKLVNPANKRKYKIIVVGTGLAGASAASENSVITSRLSAIRTARGGGTVSQLREVLMRPRIIPMTVTVSSGFSMTRSRVEISAPEKQMSTVSHC